MRLLLCALALLSSGLTGQSTGPTAIQFALVDRATIEARLRLAPNTNDLRETGVKDMFAAAGCPNLSEPGIRESRVPNVTCTLAGSSASTILIGAHTDKVGAGTGIIDDWSGAALLASLYQSLVGQPRRHTFIFIGFSDEEAGLYGSAAYAQAMNTAERRAVRAMINIDSLAAGPTRIWPAHSVPELANALGRVASAQKVPLSAGDPGPGADDDSSSFIARGLPTLMVHSLGPETMGLLHSNGDSPAHVRWDDYYDSYRLLAGFLAYLDTLPDPPQSSAPIVMSAPDGRSPIPKPPPPGATALCNDGKYSFDTNPRTTCSAHAGVRQWVN